MTATRTGGYDDGYADNLRLTLGHADLKLAASTHTRVTVKVSRSGYGLLVKATHLGVDLTAALKDPSGSGRTVKGRLTFKAPPQRRHRK